MTTAPRGLRAAPTGSPPDEPCRLREGFIVLTETLLKSVSEVFPECFMTESALKLFETMVKGNAEREDRFIRCCAQLFNEHSAALQNRDVEALFAVADGMTLLKDLDLRGKWSDPDFSEASKDHLWQYILSLKTYAELYCALPAAVMGKIERLAGDIGEKLRAGTLDLSSINVSEVGGELLGQLSADELKTFEGNLPRIFESISQVASTVASQAGGGGAGLDVEGLMRTLVQTQQGGAASQGDASALLQAMGGLLAPSKGLCGGTAAEPSLEALNSVMSLLQTSGLVGSDPRPGAGFTGHAPLPPLEQGSASPVGKARSKKPPVADKKKNS